VLKSLRKEVAESKTRSSMGVFIICIIATLSLFTYALGGLHYLLKVVPNSTYVTLPITLALGLFLLLMINYFQMPLREVGITLINWKRSLFEGIVFTIPIVAVSATAVKWVLMTFVPHYQGRPFFDPFALILDPSDRTWAYWMELNLVYWFIIIPVQELLSRGALQGLLERFLIGKHRIVLSILASNLIFSSVHVFFSPYIAFSVFIAGCYLGWLYSRSHNLLGCFVAHIIIGTVALSILGIVGIIYE